MTRLIIISILILLAGYTKAGGLNIAPPDSSQSLIEKAKIQKWMTDARHKMFERDWRGALGTYREVLSIDPNNAKAEFRTAQCQYELTAYEYAIQHIEKAEKLAGPDIDKEFYYTYGLLLQRLKRFDEAVEALEKFKAQEIGDSENKEWEYETEKLIAECKRAKDAIKNPTKATIKSIGDEVNSRYREYGAVLSPDGKELYFTSRRQDTKEGGIAPDHVFYEDIYVSKWNEEDGIWGDPENIPGRMNTENFDAVSHLLIDDRDNLIMYATTNVIGWTQSSDISTSRMNSKGTWGKPRLLDKRRKGREEGINTSYAESCPTLTANGDTMYFVAEGQKGQGRMDIYYSVKDGNDWGLPVNVGDSINTANDENTVWVSPNGKHLFFSSNGHAGLGGYDIYVSTKVNGKWTKPKNLGYPINSVDDDSHFRLINDGKQALMTSIREDGKGFHDIYIIDLNGYKIW